MFDYLLSKPITLNTFNIIEHKLRQIYDYIINHAEDYSDVTDLFKSTSYQNGEFKIKEQMLEELKDILSTFSYAINVYIEDTMDSWYYYKKDTQPILDDPDPTDEDWNNMFNAKCRVTDLIDILFGFEVDE